MFAMGVLYSILSYELQNVSLVRRIIQPMFLILLVPTGLDQYVCVFTGIIDKVRGGNNLDRAIMILRGIRHLVCGIVQLSLITLLSMSLNFESNSDQKTFAVYCITGVCIDLCLKTTNPWVYAYRNDHN